MLSKHYFLRVREKKIEIKIDIRFDSIYLNHNHHRHRHRHHRLSLKPSNIVGWIYCSERYLAIRHLKAIQGLEIGLAIEN